jgi:NAD(P)-dependent dehydrogenase (short-subunit alcohol dehydrogenase family)
MEGKFYRHKTPNHPHTNMAKAALNMMTRTSAAELAEKKRVFMTAVDTGWINDENPRHIAARIAKTHDFQTPIDEVDAAARVLHPVFHGYAPGVEPLRGVFLKDYVATEW